MRKPCIELDVGSLCRTRSLVITDTFGIRTLLKPSSESGEPHASWRMFQHASVRGNGPTSPASNLFFLPPALLRSVESRPLEEVLLLRDELANLAWAVERLIESPTDRPLNRFEVYLEQQRRRARETVEGDSSPPEVLRYRLSTEIPDYWIPLMPVRIGQGLRLQRGDVLKTDGSRGMVQALGRVLESGQALSLFEEEVPREGIRVTRGFQLTRWIDGSSHLWVGRRKGVGRGQGSSGLQFDSLET